MESIELFDSIESFESKENTDTQINQNQNQNQNQISLKVITHINDFIPIKYNRNHKNDIIIKYLTFCMLIVDALIFFGTIQNTLYFLNGIFPIINFILVLIFLLLDIPWLHYKMQHIVMGLYKLIMNLTIFRSNSKYYSGLEIPNIFLLNRSFPPLTIQLPVYKEDLENTIKPTIISAMEQATRYTKETGSVCNIIVCDDGYNLISNEEREKRYQFYYENNIGFTARPHPSKHCRRGRFKKAGNLNFSLNYSNTNTITNDAEETKENNDKVNREREKEKEKDKEKEQMQNIGAVFEGNLMYGSYIFLIDSDTRFPQMPENETGCLKRIIKDIIFDGEKSVLYIQCYTAPYMSTRCLAEKGVFHYTCNIYNGIMIGCSLHSMSPLVGHNALLNVKLLEEIAIVDPETKYKYYWDENRISEDFDCMMRGCEKGYLGRYMCCSGSFLEGISFNYMTEYFKVSKFACGAAEMTFNPVSKWFDRKGIHIFSPDIIRFMGCKEIEWYNKINIMSYILNFIAISQAHFAVFYNLIFFDQLFDVLPFALLPTNLMWEGMVVWGGMNTIICIFFAKRMQFDMVVFLKQQCREIFFTSSLYGSLSVRFSIMYFTHLFNLNINFGATQKDEEKVSLLDWIKSTKYECMVYTFYLICVFIRMIYFPVISIFVTFYFGCIPISFLIFWYWFGPLAYDILPSKKNKKIDNTIYMHDEKMFNDEYKTQILHSDVFVKNIPSYTA